MSSFVSLCVVVLACKVMWPDTPKVTPAAIASAKSPPAPKDPLWMRFFVGLFVAGFSIAAVVGAVVLTYVVVTLL